MSVDGNPLTLESAPFKPDDRLERLPLAGERHQSHQAGVVRLAPPSGDVACAALMALT